MNWSSRCPSASSTIMSSGWSVLDPDASVQQSIRHLLATFAATGSAYACVKAFADEALKFPRRIRTGPNKGELTWGILQHHRVLQVLHNPRYAGAFCYGRHAHSRGPGGKTTTRVLPRDQWTVLITDAHPGYLTWAEFEANQARLAELAAAHGTDRKASPPREGAALLQGVVSCGKCGRRMTVRYQHYKGTGKPIYLCQFEGIRNAVPICQTMVGDQIDAAVGELLLATLTPLTLEVALRVSDELADRAEEADRLRAACVERARYRADLARRRYLAVDPANRLVADTLEADWNDALRELAETTEEYDRAKNTAIGPLSPETRARITALAADFPGSGTTRPPRCGNANAYSDSSSPTSPSPRPTTSPSASSCAADSTTTSPCPARKPPGNCGRPTRPSSPRSTNSSTSTPTPKAPPSSTNAACPAAWANRSPAA